MNREELRQRALGAADRCLREKGYIAMVDVFIAMNLLAREDHERWRFRRVSYLERVVRCPLPAINAIMRAVAENFRRGNLRPSSTAYVSWGKDRREPLRLSKSGDPNLERAYATHWLRPKTENTEDATVHERC